MPQNKNHFRAFWLIVERTFALMMALSMLVTISKTASPIMVNSGVRNPMRSIVAKDKTFSLFYILILVQ